MEYFADVTPEETRMLRFAAFITAGIFFSTANAEIVATQSVEKEIVAKGENGQFNVTRVSASKVSPGEEVIYILDYENRDGAPAEGVVLVMPVPSELVYIEGSVTGDGASASFSADGGQTYLTRGRLMVNEDGQQRPARGSEITHIKWTLAEPMAPSAEGRVTFRGILK